LLQEVYYSNCRAFYNIKMPYNFSRLLMFRNGGKGELSPSKSLILLHRIASSKTVIVFSNAFY
jgi:hypothetical protein